MAFLAFVALVGSWLASMALTVMIRSWSRRRGFVDAPGGRKAHDAPIALGGGVAICAAICLPVVLGTLAFWLMDRSSIPQWLPEILHKHVGGVASKFPTVLGIMAGAVVLHVVGLIDDRKALGPGLKLLVQLIVALLVSAVLGIRLLEAFPAPISILLTVIWVVLITNAFNFLDNMDGLSAGVAVIAATVFAVAAMRTGQVFVPVMAWIVVGASLGFLVFNFSPATVFMGDAGSLVIGYMMAVLTILTTFYDPGQKTSPFGILVPVVVLSVPLYDVTSVVIHRLRRGESPFHGDRRHFSHRLVRRGMTERGAVLTIYLATAATALPAVLLPKVDWTGALMLLLQCACVVVMIAILEHAGSRDSQSA